MTAPVRSCLACGQTDDHPRHMVVLSDGSEAFWHMDCHSRISPPCSVCAEVISGADGVTGDALRSHILTPKD